MSKTKWLVLLAAVAALGLTVGCEDDDDSGDSGAFAGTWTGNVGGRGLTMVIAQRGTSLSGSYTFTDPTFTGTFRGSASSATPPATARLDCVGRDWWFDVTFASSTRLSGDFYKVENNGVPIRINAAK